MKPFIYKKILVVIYLVFLLGVLHAQNNDSIAYSEERKDTSDYRYRRLYQYLDINMKDEKLMFKLSPDFSLSNYSKHFGLQLSYEQKIYKQFSFLVTTRNSFLIQTTSSLWGGSSWDSKNSYFNSNLGAGFRWYFNLNTRIENGTSGNNLSGLYAEAGLENIANYSNGEKSVRPSNFVVQTNYGFHVFETFNPRVAVGFQRRFNNWSYFDIFTTANWSQGLFFWDLGFRLGFAWGK
jgi:hypothetical protein